MRRSLDEKGLARPERAGRTCELHRSNQDSKRLARQAVQLLLPLAEEAHVRIRSLSLFAGLLVVLTVIVALPPSLAATMRDRNDIRGRLDLRVVSGQKLADGSLHVRISTYRTWRRRLLRRTSANAIFVLFDTNADGKVDHRGTVYASHGHLMMRIAGHGRTTERLPVDHGIGDTISVTLPPHSEANPSGPAHIAVRTEFHKSARCHKSCVDRAPNRGWLTVSPSPTRSYVVPTSIPSDCSVDVTPDLNTWIASVPGSSTLEFPSNSCYRIDETLLIRNRFDLTVEGNGATLKAMTIGDQNRKQLWFIGGGNLTVRDLTVIGANPYAGAWNDLAYNPDYAGQHGFALDGVQGAVLDHVKAHDVWGDLVRVGCSHPSEGVFVPSRNITIKNSRFERNGRQGISVDCAEDVSITNNYIGDIRRALFDIEPTSKVWPVHRIRFVGNTTGSHRGNWLSNAGAGGENVSDIYVGHNTGNHGYSEIVNPTNASARQNYLFEYNVFSDSFGVGVQAPSGGRGILNVIVRNNSGYNHTHVGVWIINAHHVQVYNNVFHDSPAALQADPSSSDYKEWNNRLT